MSVDTRRARYASVCETRLVSASGPADLSLRKAEPRHPLSSHAARELLPQWPQSQYGSSEQS